MIVMIIISIMLILSIKLCCDDNFDAMIINLRSSPSLITRSPSSLVSVTSGLSEQDHRYDDGDDDDDDDEDDDGDGGDELTMN